jgi:Protein of unknown function (DUF2948)
VTMPSPSQSDEMLRFAVVDEEDLAVMSAHLQDARLAIENATFLTGTRRFAAVVSRIDWQAFASGQQRRRQTGFHFECVSRVQRSGFDAADDAPLQLLAIAFRPTTAPAGEVLLTFAGGRAIKLDVECLEAEMRDLTACWPVSDCPRHRLDAAEVGR